MASFEVQGDIHSIDVTKEYGQNGFTKREFVIKLTGEGENPSFPNYVPLEFTRDKCAVLDDYQVGDSVKVGFNLGGRLWAAPGKPERCFVNLQAWRIEKLNAAANPSDGYEELAGSVSDDFDQAPFDDDVPF